MSRTAYSYGRFSTIKQADGDSIARQETAFLGFCRLHKLTPATDYRFFDRARSAWKAQHVKSDSELIRLIKKAKEECNYDPDAVIVVEDMDRLTRLPPFEAQALAKEILDTGWSIGCVSDGQIYSKKSMDDIGPYLTLAIKFHIGWAYSQRLSGIMGDRWEGIKDKAIKERKPFGHIHPRWITYDEKADRYDLHSIHGTTVARIYDMADLGYSQRTIALTLHAEHVPCFGRSGRWTVSEVRTVLNSKAAYGAITLHTKRGRSEERKAVSDEFIFYPAAVTHEKWKTVREKMKARSAVTEGRPASDGTIKNLFSGIAYVGNTDKSIYYTRKSRGKKRYEYLFPSDSAATTGYVNFPYREFELGFFTCWSHWLPVEEMGKTKSAQLKDELLSLLSPSYSKEVLTS